MADNTTVDNGALTDYTVADDDDGTAKHQYVKLEWGADGVFTKVSSGANAVPIQDGGNSITVDGTVAVSSVGGSVTIAEPVSIDDNGGSITVDGTVTTTPSGDHTVVGKAADGAAVSGNPVLIAGQDGANVQSISTNATGHVNIADGGNSITVDGTVALSAGSANIGDVDVLTVPAPLSTTGGGTEATALRVTVANDSTGVLSIDDNGGSITVDGTVSVTEPVSIDDNAGSITVDAPVGTPVNVQIGDATNTATIRNLAANDALNVSIVDGAGDQITSFGGGTQYTEDAAAAANPVGTAPILVRQDTPATLVSTDGDNVAARGTNYGAQFVQVVSSGGAFIDSFGGSGGTAQADESAFTEGTTNMTPIGGVLNDTITSDPTEDQAAAVRITPKRAFHSNLRKNDGTEIASGGGTEANALRVTVASDSTGVLSVDDNGGSLTIDNAALSVVGGGAEATALRVTVANDSTGVLSIDDNGGSITVDGTVSVTEPVSVDDNGGSLTVDNGGTFAIQDSQKLADNTAFTDGTTPVQPGGYIYDEVAGTALTENDIAAARIDDKRAQISVIESGSVRGQRAGVDTDSRLLVGVAKSAAAADAASNTANQVVDVGGNARGLITYPYSYNGTTWDRLRNGGGTEATALRVTVASDSTGVLSVDDNGGSITIDNTNLENATLADNAAFTDGTTRVVMGGYAFDETAGTVLTENDAAAARVDSKRAQVLVIEDETTRGRRTTVTAANALKVDGSAVTQPVSGTVTANQGTAGTAWEIVGDVANDVAANANPVTIGGRASTAVPTAVSTDGDAVHAWLSRNGAQVITQAPHVGLNSDPWNLVHEAAQYTTTQTSTVLVAGGASEKIVVTKVQIQAGGTTAGTLQLYFGTGAFARGTNRAVFDGEFAPSATLKPGVIMDGPFIAGTNGDDLMVTTSAAINPLTINVWYYVVT